ncbi:TPA: hypothetical protein ACH3X1_003633 [Trebouxia sp. C0004]
MPAARVKLVFDAQFGKPMSRMAVKHFNTVIQDADCMVLLHVPHILFCSQKQGPSIRDVCYLQRYAWPSVGLQAQRSHPARGFHLLLQLNNYPIKTGAKVENLFCLFFTIIIIYLSLSACA